MNMPKSKDTGQLSLSDYQLQQVDVRLVLKDGNPLYSTRSMDGPRQAVEVMREAMKEMDREMVCVVNMDNKLRPINYHVVSIGGIAESLVPVQNVFKSGILSNAGNIMMLHNHPSGEVMPSREDEVVTKRITEAGKLMNIPVLDHIIVGAGTGELYSFREHYPELFDRGLDMSFIEEMNGGVREMANNYSTAERIANAQHLPQEQEEAVVSFLHDYDQVKDALFVRISGADRADDRIANAPHETKEDLVMTYHVRLDIPGEGVASTMVTNDMLKMFGVPEEQMKTDAMANSQEMMPVRMAPMATILFGVPEEEAMMDGQMPMMVITNEEKMFGASALFYPGAMDQMAEKLEGNFFILPSSVHEVIAIPNDGSQSVNELEQMVQEINASQVEPRDQLSDRVYHFDARERTFELAANHEERMKQKEQDQEKGSKSVLKRLGEKKQEAGKAKDEKPQMRPSHKRAEASL